MRKLAGLYISVGATSASASLQFVPVRQWRATCAAQDRGEVVRSSYPPLAPAQALYGSACSFSHTITGMSRLVRFW